MASGDEKKILTPSVKWAQQKNSVSVTIEVTDLKNPDLKLEKDKITFSCIGGAERNEYAFSLEFFKEIDPEKSTYLLNTRNIPITLKKVEEGTWDRLCKDNKKLHWIKTDFDKWVDDDESDEGGKLDGGFENMMSKMGSFQPPNNDYQDEEEEDSDDEDLPDLE